MRTWAMEPALSRGSAVADAATGLIDAIGTERFDDAMLDAVNARIEADSLCVYRLSSSAPPRRYCAASREKADSTGSCWQLYRSGIYRADETFAEAHEHLRTSSLVIGHITAREVRYGPHRQCIYDRHQLLDRLSASSAEPNGDLLALNVYRHRDLGHFRDREIACFEEVSTVLMAAVRRHAALGCADTEVGVSHAERVEHYERMLAREQPALTSRERAVCARLLTGMLYDGIAADLGIGVATIKTYRQRAFDRLGIHFRNELLGIALDAQRRTPRA